MEESDDMDKFRSLLTMSGFMMGFTSMSSSESDSESLNALVTGIICSLLDLIVSRRFASITFKGCSVLLFFRIVGSSKGGSITLMGRFEGAAVARRFEIILILSAGVIGFFSVSGSGEADGQVRSSFAEVVLFTSFRDMLGSVNVGSESSYNPKPYIRW